MSERCVLLLGGSFDPVHAGHVALARYFCTLLHPDELRLLPAGRPWQKPDMNTPPAHRVAMLQRAFADWPVPVVVDEREIRRDGPSYAIDTLRELRAELGDDASLVMALGADQLQNLTTWRDWTQLFDMAHLCFASRPGFGADAAQLPPELATQIGRRLASPAQLRATSHGLAFIAGNLALDISSSAIRLALAQGDAAGLAGALPEAVLDYIRHHHLYPAH